MMVDMVAIQKMSDLELESKLDGHLDQLGDIQDELDDLRFYGQPWHNTYVIAKDGCLRTVSWDCYQRDLVEMAFVLERLSDAYAHELRLRKKRNRR